MKRLSIKIIIALFSITLFSTSNAQFSISAQIKTLAELRDGYKTPAYKDSKPAFMICQRTRINFVYKNDKIELKLSPQDVRVWGSTKQLEVKSTMYMHEAWAKLKFNENWSIKFGRQELIYNDHRLMGNVDWVAQARSHDALLLLYEKDGWRFDAGGAFNQHSKQLFGTNYYLDNYKVLAWAYGQKKFDNVTTHLLFINDGTQKQDSVKDMSFKHTIGGGAIYNVGDFKLQGDFYWQAGKTKTNAKIAAYMLAFKASYSQEKFGISLGTDIISGDKTGDNRYQAFNTLFATNHKFYGHMDYFLNIPKDTKAGGLTDIYINASYTPSKKVVLAATYHHFLLTNKVSDPSFPFDKLKKNLGAELDFSLTHKIRSYIAFQCGVSTYLPTYSTQQIKGGDKDIVSYWSWAKLSITPEIFSTKKAKKNE